MFDTLVIKHLKESHPFVLKVLLVHFSYLITLTLGSVLHSFGHKEMSSESSVSVFGEFVFF